MLLQKSPKILHILEDFWLKILAIYLGRCGRVDVSLVYMSARLVISAAE